MRKCTSNYADFAWLCRQTVLPAPSPLIEALTNHGGEGYVTREGYVDWHLSYSSISLNYLVNFPVMAQVPTLCVWERLPFLFTGASKCFVAEEQRWGTYSSCCLCNGARHKITTSQSRYVSIKIYLRWNVCMFLKGLASNRDKVGICISWV